MKLIDVGESCFVSSITLMIVWGIIGCAYGVIRLLMHDKMYMWFGITWVVLLVVSLVIGKRETK